MGRARRENGHTKLTGTTAAGVEDLEAKRERARSAFTSYRSQPLDDRPMIAPTTDGHRYRSMLIWKSYFTDVVQIDPDQVWLDLCRGTEDAKNYCRVFLRSYVEESFQKFAVLGSEEYEYRRTVNSASSVTQTWRELIAQADSTVLREKRRTDPDNFHLWRLKFLDHTNQRGQGPIFEISQWIFQKLAKELNLAVTLTFEKVEATTNDMLVFLNTLWERAEDIPCQPTTRVSFHGIVLLAGIGGFRRGTIMCLKYRDVSLAVVRDPNDRSKTKLVITPTIGKNKIKRATRVSRATSISFSMTLVPYSTVCLTSIIAARAIKDDAFEPSFESVEALLSRPALENVDFLPLKWKESMLDRPIFQLSSATFSYLWHRTCLVSGLRVDPRFYAMRVGVGARLDGVLTDAVRNYVLSNTTQVFQSSYQTNRVREDLTKLAFGSMAGRNDSLFQNLRSISLRRDADAPIDPSIEDLQEFEERNDVKGFRASISAAQKTGDKKAVRSIKSQLDTLIGTLSSLKVQEKRDRYFDRVDSLRAQGLSTTDAAKDCAPENTISRKRSHGAATAIARLMQSCTSDIDECSVEQPPKAYMELLVDYLAYRPQATPKYDLDTDDEAEDKNEADSADDDQNRKKDKPSRCLLGCGSFRGRSELTKHYQRVHVKKGTFDRPLSCPECQQQGVDSVIEGGPSAWSNHVETVHGKIHAPNLPSYIHPVMGSSQCLLCEGYFMQGGGLTRHIRRTHEKKEGIFNQLFPCPECHRQGGQGILIDGISAWYDHIASAHGDVSLPLLQPLPALSLDEETTGTRKRKRDEDVPAGLDDEAAAVVSDWVEDMTITTDTAGTTPDMWTDSATSGSQSPASSVDSGIIERIDPRLLSDRSRESQKRVKSNQLDIEQENLEIDYASSADPQPKDDSLFHTRTISSLDVEPIEPILSTDCFHHRPDITTEQVQGATETKENPLPEETTTPEPTLTGFEVSDPYGRSENLLPNCHDTSQVRLQSQAEFSQQAAQAEKEVEARPTPASTPDPEGLGSDIAELYWGRGYALAREGSELNRLTNNARRREEISSNINPEHVIKGKRLRTRKS